MYHELNFGLLMIMFGVSFWKKIYFGFKEGTMENLLIIWDEETWLYIILSLDCLIFREINSCNKFLSLLFFFPWYEHSLFVNVTFDFDNILLSFEFSFSFFPFFSWCFFLGRFWYVPWTEFQLAYDFVWGIFLKENLFWVQRGYNGKFIDYLGWRNMAIHHFESWLLDFQRD